MMQYNESAIDVNFRIGGMDNPVLFRMDGVKRDIIAGGITVRGTRLVIVMNASDARMTIEQTDEGWQITEEKLFCTPSIRIDGSIHSPNVNIGGTQVITGGVNITWKK